MKDRLGDAARLAHIIDAIQSIRKWTVGISYEMFEQNDMLLNACVRQLEIIGEAANHLSEEAKSRYGMVEWRKIVALRNLLIHQYFGVVPEMLWQIIQHDLPILYAQIQPKS